jgi:Protein of unknown function (DUF3108)
MSCMVLRPATRLASNACITRPQSSAQILFAAAIIAGTAMGSGVSLGEVLRSRYALSYDGLRAGDAIIQTVLEGKRYKIAVSADVGTILVSTQIRGEASGARTGAKLTPEHFQLILSGGEEGAIDVRFTDAAAADQGGPRLKGVFDPLSALLSVSLKPPASAHPCNSVFPIFTGRDRFNLTLSPKRATAVEQHAGLVVCEAAGGPQTRQGSAEPELKWEIAFMKLAKPRFWLVERIVLPSAKGTVRIDRAETSISGL